MHSTYLKGLQLDIKKLHLFQQAFPIICLLSVAQTQPYVLAAVSIDLT